MAGILQHVVSNAGPIIAGILGFHQPQLAAKIVGGVLVAGGAAGYLYPISIAKLFGIPFADENNSIFFPGIGGRNMAAGIAMLVLSWLEENRALGILVAAWTLAGFSDIGILLAIPNSRNIWIHVRNVCVLTLICWSLLLEK